MKNARLYLLFYSMIVHLQLFSQSFSSWKGESDSQWSNSLNWTNGVPCDTVQAILGDSNFIGAYHPIILSSSRCNSLVLDSIIPVTLIVSNEFYIQGDIKILSQIDTLFHSAGKITVRGNWENNGTYLTTGITSQVAFGGSNQHLLGTASHSFNKLHINGGSSLLLSSNINVKELSLNGTLNPNQGPSYFIDADSIIINNEGVLLVNTWNFEDCYSVYPRCNAGGIVDYASTTTDQIVNSNIVYATLKISGEGTKKLETDLPELLSNELEAGRIYVNAGTFDLGEYTANRGTTIEGGYFTVANGATLRIGGQTIDFFPQNYKTNSLKDSSIVEYYGGGTQLVNPRNYGNLVLSSSYGDAIKILPTTVLNIDGNLSIKLSGGQSVSVQTRSRLNVLGDIDIALGTILNGGSFQHSIGGNWHNTGIYNAGTSTVNFNGLSKHIQGINSFRNLIINGFYTLINNSEITSNGSIKICDTAILAVEQQNQIQAKTIRIESSGRFENKGITIISDSVILVANDTNTAQLLNDGTITNNGVVCLEKRMLASTGWYFMSFPFDVLASHITDANTKVELTWGGLSEIADFYVAAYDGASRDASGNANISGAGNYWIDVNPKQLTQYKGYIVATEVDRIILFASAPGENSLFDSVATIGIYKWTSNSSSFHHSWNLCGNPFSASFDLLHASQDQAPFYLYDGFTYQTVMPGDSYKINPFSAYFLQATGIDSQIIFNTDGLGFRSALQVDEFDEIDLRIDDGRHFDRLRLRINEGASIGYEKGVDGFKMLSLRSDIPQLYSRVGGLSYSVNTLPLIKNGNTIVPISNYTGQSGTYYICLAHSEKIKYNSQVLLIDSITGSTINLLEDTIYQFSTTSKGTTHNRFSIVLPNKIITHTKNISHNTIKLIVNGYELYFTGLEGKASLVITDITGKLVSIYSSVTNYQTLPISLKGIYLVRIITDNQVKQFKVYV